MYSTLQQLPSGAKQNLRRSGLLLLARGASRRPRGAIFFVALEKQDLDHERRDNDARPVLSTSYSGSVTSTAPNPGIEPSMKNVSIVMSGSTWACDRKATTLRPV